MTQQVTAPPRVKRNPFEAFHISVRVPSLSLSGAQSRAIKKDLQDNPENRRKMQNSCAVAEAVGRALGATYIPRNRYENRIVVHPMVFDGVGEFIVNPNARPRFGVTKTGTIFLTVGLIKADHPDPAKRTRWRLTWYGKDIPKRLVEIAQHHDSGDGYGGTMATLKLADAVVRRSVTQLDPRGPRNEGKNGKDEVKPGGEVKRRVHRRFECVDLEKIYN